MKNLIQQLIDEGYLKTPAIIDAFYNVKREDFMPAEVKDQASANHPLPIGFGQTISQPLTVAFMLELLQPKVGDKVLDVGSGSGWQSGLLAHIVSKGNKLQIADPAAREQRGDCRLQNDAGMNEVSAGKVYAIERIRELMEFGRENVGKYNFVKKGVVEFHCGDGSKGLPDKAPFDKIIVAAATPDVPEALKEQLKVGGRLVLPVGSRTGQDIVLLIKEEDNNFTEQRYPGFIFVPLVRE